MTTSWLEELADHVRAKEGLPDGTELPGIKDFAAAITPGPSWLAEGAAACTNLLAELNARLAAKLNPDPADEWPLPHPVAVTLRTKLYQSAIGMYALNLALDRAKNGCDYDQTTAYRIPDWPAGVRDLLARMEAWYDREKNGRDYVPTTAYRFLNAPSAVGTGLNATQNLYQGALDRGEDLPHPIWPLIKDWFNRPRLRPAETRPDRLFPTGLYSVTMDSEQHTRTLGLFSNTQPNKQLTIPTMGQLDTTPPLALPVAIYELGAGSEGLRGGKGAPLAFRLFVETILAVRVDDRGEYVSLSIPLRDLLERLYPNRFPSPSQYWGRFEAAVEAISSNAARIPWYDPKRGSGGLWRVVNVVSIPRDARFLDDHVVFEVSLPPGVRGGPPVSPNLPNWGVKSAPAYRLALNLPVHWWKPGTTYRPYAKGRSWGMSPNPDHYQPLTHDDLIRFAYPTSATQSRRVLRKRALETLELLQEAGDVGAVEVEGRSLHVLPPWAVKHSHKEAANPGGA